MDAAGTYAPQSPDLSSFLSSPSAQHHPHPQSQSQSHPPQPPPPPQPLPSYDPSYSTSYAPRSPTLPSANNHPSNPPPHQAPNRPHHQNLHAFHPPQPPSFGNNFSDDGSTRYMPPVPTPSTSHAFAPNSASFYSPPLNPSSTSYQPPSSTSQAHDNHHPGATMSTRAGRGGARVKDEPATTSTSAMTAAAAAAYKNPNPQGIEIKTKFPVARIKRIMQADEEVGKVAQVTPVAVNKALELFMIGLVTGAAERAREKGGKRVTAQHLKMVVEADEQFDFLGEIVGRVAEVQENAGGEGKKRKEKVGASDSEEEEKKPKKGKGRRKKNDD